MAAEDAMPSLLEQARAKMQAKGQRCSIATLLKDHPEVVELLEQTGSGKPIHYSTTAEVINEALDTNYDGQTFSRHLNRKCGCPR